MAGRVRPRTVTLPANATALSTATQTPVVEVQDGVSDRTYKRRHGAVRAKASRSPGSPGAPADSLRGGCRV